MLLKHVYLQVKKKYFYKSNQPVYTSNSKVAECEVNLQRNKFVNSCRIVVTSEPHSISRIKLKAGNNNSNGSKKVHRKYVKTSPLNSELHHLEKSNIIQESKHYLTDADVPKNNIRNMATTLYDNSTRNNMLAYYCTHKNLEKLQNSTVH